MPVTVFTPTYTEPPESTVSTKEEETTSPAPAPRKPRRPRRGRKRQQDSDDCDVVAEGSCKDKEASDGRPDTEGNTPCDQSLRRTNA